MAARHGADKTAMTLLCGCADNIRQRIRGEYREMPGLQLSLTQACRPWHLEPSASEAYLKALEEEGFLGRNRTGEYARLDAGSPRRVVSPRRT